TPKEFLRFSRTCKEADAAVSAYIAKAFDVDKRLRRFFSDPLAFRHIQARTATLISGSFALQLFDRTSYMSSDLDLYLHLEHRRTVGRWLLDEAGYSFSPYRGQEEDFESAVLHKISRRGIRYSMPGVADILTFRKAQIGGDTLKVQLIVARRTPMEVVLGFHSTCVMNVISYQQAYCLFPHATVESHRSLLSWSSQSRSTRRAEGLEKYKKRGFHMEHHLSPAELSAPIRESATPFALGPRWLGDADTWVIPLETSYIPYPPPPNPYSTGLYRDPVSVASFSVRYDPSDGAIMTFSVIESEALKYAYALGDEGLADYLSCILGFKEMDNLTNLGYALEDIR
ncbi:hypothetical protein LXA43DRAFT_895612, partial [Ganoderma leucocontextum]